MKLSIKKLLTIAVIVLLIAAVPASAARRRKVAPTTSPDQTPIPGISGSILTDDISQPTDTSNSAQSQQNITEEIPDDEALSGPIIESVTVTGNTQVVSEHILSVVTSKVGSHVNETRLRKDSDAIFELGFFVNVDYRVKDVRGGAVEVAFEVQENPIVDRITFTGNTVFSAGELSSVMFTKPGMIFNRTFFRNDLQRIKEKYQTAGYAMANVEDVQINDSSINVVIVEPKISQIIIQGNKITKKSIIERYMKIKEGELFNSNKLRLTLNRLQGLGFFNDVNVNFEPGEMKDEVVVVFTVEEGKTARLGFNIAYGTQSGLGGGITYENFNIAGKALKLSTGFQLGNREEIWATLEQPYMDGKTYAWRVGIYKRAWDDLYYYDEDNSSNWLFEYDRDKYGVFFGLGKKFSDRSLFNWYVQLDWHTVSNDTDATGEYAKENWGNIYVNKESTAGGETILDDLGDGDYYSATFTIRRYNVDEYLPYTKGDSESINIQPGHAKVEGTSYNYVKYWFEGKYYTPVDKILGKPLQSLGINTLDRPPIFAARVMVGTSSGDVPYDEMYTIGGDYTLRGYEDEYYHGEDMLLGNFELRIPLQKSLTIVAFYDVGRAWRSGGEASFGSDLGSAPGAGVRLKTPLGNIRLDYASGEEGRFHFGFGEMF